MNREQEILQVKCLGEDIGYGNLMYIASALWRYDLKKNNYPTDGAFIATIGRPNIEDLAHDKEVEKLLTK